MPKTTIADLLYLPDCDALRFLPEGPTALGGGEFSWVAIQHGADATSGSLNIFNIASGVNKSFPLPGRPGFAKPTSAQGMFLVGCERELGIFDITNSSWTQLASGIDRDVGGTIINDGTLYGDNVIFGTKDLEFSTPKAGLYLYRGTDKSLTRLRNDQICSNGKDVVDLGEGGLQLIDIDSPTKKIVRYKINIEQGRLSDCTTLVDLSDAQGVPDGMILTPDEQSLIVSLYNPDAAEFGETRQYGLLNGELEHVWLTPGSPQATCPLLLDTSSGDVKLVITTAVENMPAQRRAHSTNAGGLFIADTTFRHAPATPRFALPG